MVCRSSVVVACRGVVVSSASGRGMSAVARGDALASGDALIVVATAVPQDTPHAVHHLYAAALVADV